MTGPVIQNFRGARALIVMGEDPNRATIAETLRRLGLLVATAEPGSRAAAEATACDVILFDADEGLGGVFDEAAMPDVPTIAVIGVEAPGRLARVVRQRAAGYLMKPVRAGGVFTALFLAFNEHRLRRRDAAELQALAERMRGRRDLVKAILRIMAETGVDDEEAFRRLRAESMRRRITIEALARERLEGAATEAPPEKGSKTA